jgi:hypothetical protein
MAAKKSQISQTEFKEFGLSKSKPKPPLPELATVDKFK